MIPIEKLRQVTVVYTHAKCPDGMATAMILKDAFRMLFGVSDTPIVFLVHDTPEHHDTAAMEWPKTRQWTEGFALFCDICPPGPNPDPDIARRTIVLDHHKGTRDIVEAFGENGVYADAVTEPGVSGATLAFREVWAPIWDEQVRTEGLAWKDNTATTDTWIRVKEFAECSGIRDCWVTSDPRFMRGQWISKMLMAKPASYWLQEGGRGDPPFPYLTAAEMEDGRCLFEAHLDTVRQAFEQRVESVAIGGTRLVVVAENPSGARIISDVAQMVRDVLGPTDLQYVVASFCYLVDKPGAVPKLSYSLRGINFGVDALARMYGGNGHHLSAGFSVDCHFPTPDDHSVHRAWGGSSLDPYNYIRLGLHRFLDPNDNPSIVPTPPEVP